MAASPPVLLYAAFLFVKQTKITIQSLSKESKINQPTSQPSTKWAKPDPQTPEW